MSRQFQFLKVNGYYTASLQSMILRLNRKLGELMPCRQLWYNNRLKNYMLRVIAPGSNDHLIELGPYYFKYLCGLGDHINLWTLAERELQPKGIITRDQQLYPQEPLPPALRFKVFSQVLADAIRACEGAGFKVTGAEIPPYVPAPTMPVVTVPVTGEPPPWITPDEAEGN